jgi:hypothetical protein
MIVTPNPNVLMEPPIMLEESYGTPADHSCDCSTIRRRRLLRFPQVALVMDKDRNARESKLDK